MADEKKKPEEEKAEPTEPQANTEPPNEPKDEPKPEDKPQDTPENKPADEEPKADEGAELQAEEPAQPSKDSPEAELPKLSVEDELRAENFALKTQLEAMKLGLIPDYIDDAVVLAENIVKREGSDIATALQAVAKKYPDWKQQAGDKGKHKGGFKIGSDGGNSKPTSEDKLNNAFGIKKKGEFPNENSLLKLLYLRITELYKKWENSKFQNWAMVRNQLIINENIRARIEKNEHLI